MMYERKATYEGQELADNIAANEHAIAACAGLDFGSSLESS